MMYRLLVLLAMLTCDGLASGAHAHVMPWRAGESRQIGFGHCAKGPCTMRTYWGNGKPHRHVDGKVIFETIVNRLR